MAMLLVMGGMLLMLVPFMPDEPDEAMLVGVSRALRRAFWRPADAPVPGDMTAQLDAIEDSEGNPE